jgi:hypothetical protein
MKALKEIEEHKGVERKVEHDGACKLAMKMKNIEIGGGRKVVAMMAQSFQKG